MPAPIFRKSGYSDLTLSKLIYGLDRPQTKVQVKDRTAGGQLQVEDLGITIHERVLPMSRLTDTEIADFRTWHDTVLNGAVQTFTFIDEDSVSHTARWVDDTLSAPKSSYNRQATTITVEIVSTP